MTYSFAIILKGLDDLTDEMAERIFEARCDDCTPGCQGGIVRLEFDREADATRTEAVEKALRQLKDVGFDPVEEQE
jgi:hypothetical protein